MENESNNGKVPLISKIAYGFGDVGCNFTVKPLTFRMEKSANYPYHLLRMIYSFYIYAETASFGGSHPNAFNFFKYAWIFRSALN